ncbi:metal ABC transporter permease, partial [Streptococcus anginosus]
RVYKNYSDISIAMLMSGGMALALLLMSRVESASSIEAYLFGSIVTISPVQVRLLIALAVIVLLAYFVFKRVLYVEAFD